MSTQQLEGTHHPRVVIIGGGCAGTFVAANLLRGAGTDTSPLDIVLIERSGDFGLGVAYSTGDDLHLLNVPAAKLGAAVEDPADFLAWARKSWGAVEPGDFLPRALYGRYLQHVLASAEQVSAKSGAVLRRVVGEAIALHPAASGDELHKVELADGNMITCDAVVLALGNQPPHIPDGLPVDCARVYSTPWEPGALAASDGPTTTLLVGSGLTAVDAALTLGSIDSASRVIALSRGGQLPHVHLDGGLRDPAPAPTLPDGELTVELLLTELRAHLDDATASGFDWRDVVDGIRPGIPALWGRLPVAEQRVFLQGYMRAWEVRRHRMAPQSDVRLDQLAEAGRFEVRAGHVVRVNATDAELEVHIETSGDHEVEVLNVDRVVCCTGPGLDITATPEPLVRQLLVTGVAAPDEHRLGLRATPVGQLVSRAGSTTNNVFVLGALRRGELWETTAVPEIRAQASQIA
ncbi:MAG: FAD/NAD(P)-binding protein, partial [Thermoleophilia bacterium]|nr:FAD/NAD(P)-binding protein [Thermoleophilia bacterium]